jgi:hypothetical protein
VRKRYPLGRGGTAWTLAQRSVTAARIAGRSVRSSTRLQAAAGEDLLSGPDLECKGAAAAADDGVGAVIQQLEQQDGAVAADPDEAGREELGWQLAGKTGAAVMPGQGKSRNRGI